jgi:aspartyl-tRNA synthetase
VFARILEASPKHQVWAIPAPGGGSRAFCDRMNSWAQGEGQPGLGYIMYPLDVDGVLDLADENQKRVRDQVEELRKQGKIIDAIKVLEEWQAKNRPNVPDTGPVPGAGPIANNIGLERTEAIRRQLGLRRGDAVFFVAGDPAAFVKFAGPARTKVGEDLDLIRKDRFEFCWIVDFPMYEWSEEEKKIDFSHNPFSMPNMAVEEFLALDPTDKDKVLGLKAFQYDIVCNGVELSSGAIRNHRPDVMRKAFAIAGYGEDTLEQKFGGMLRALSLGAPPHGGIAPGVDRIVMLLCGEENLREVVLFPMNQRAEDLMMGAPSEVTPKQLRELHIRLNLPDKAL